MLLPKARGPLWFGDQLRSQSSLVSWRRPHPRSSWWREWASRWLSTLSARRRASMVLRASRLGPRRLLTLMPQRRSLLHAPDVEEEVGSDHVRTMLLPARAPRADAKLSSPLVALPPPREAPSVAGVPVAPQRSPPPDSHAAAWLPLRGFAKPS
jgi:hypothetical protein